MQSGELTVRRAVGPIVGAALFIALTAVMYSAMLGFGVQERCDTLAPSSSDCNRLIWFALLHVVAQAVLAVGVGIVGVFVWSVTVSWKRIGLLAAVAFVYVCLAAIAVVVYTDAAWDWANSFE